jgi:heat shock protein HslJ
MIDTRQVYWTAAIALAVLAGCRSSGDRPSPAIPPGGHAAGDSVSSPELQAIAGTDWILERWSEAEPAPGNVEVTLRLADGRFAGFSGCNNYFCSVASGDAPGALVVGPPVGTRMACPEPAMGVEDRFLQRLGAVKSFRFLEGCLGLVYELDGESGMLRFRAQSKPQDGQSGGP